MEEIFKEYLAYLAVERGLSPNTLEAYERDIRHFFNYLKEMEISDLAAVDKYLLKNYLLRLHKEQPVEYQLCPAYGGIKKLFQVPLSGEIHSA